MHFNPNNKENSAVLNPPCKQDPGAQPSRGRNYTSQTTRTSNKRPFEEPVKCSVKENGAVKAYAASTNSGLTRTYNEDRVAIVLNILKPQHRTAEQWPRCSFYGVFDGHGGAGCADFMRDRLHQYIIRNQYFPFHPKEAIRYGFESAERAFLEKAKNTNPRDRSGSCAIVLLVIGEICYVANVGDSRAVMSGDRGDRIYALSKDHKPNEESERARIEASGGKVYQTDLGPFRVFPGRLSVSRSLGDIEAKVAAYGGNSKALIANPEIKAFKISASYDFIVIGTDGIFDKLANREVIQAAWAGKEGTDRHLQCKIAVESVMQAALDRRSLDNVTAVLVAFEGF